MSERKLATFRYIDRVRPIEGADNIEMVEIDGWQTVVQKGDYSPGDSVVYFEVDSFLPIAPQYEFLRKSCFRSHPVLGDGFRLKTIKLRGQISQGLAIRPAELFSADQIIDMVFGQDLTELLNVQKWEAPATKIVAANAEGSFPHEIIPKTDQERVQNIFGKMHSEQMRRGDNFEVTMKLDGSSMTIFVYDDFTIGVASKNLVLKMDDPDNQENPFVKTAKALENNVIEAAEWWFETGPVPENVDNIIMAFQGELMGPGVQGNRENMKEHQFFVYNIVIPAVGKRTQPRYVDPRFRRDICWDFGIAHVPVIGREYVIAEGDTVESLLEWVDGMKSINHPIAEGLVFKVNDNTTISDPNISQFKVISNRYLLKEK